MIYDSIELKCASCRRQLLVEGFEEGCLSVIPCEHCVEESKRMYQRLKKFVEATEAGDNSSSVIA